MTMTKTTTRDALLARIPTYTNVKAMEAVLADAQAALRLSGEDGLTHAEFGTITRAIGQRMHQIALEQREARKRQYAT